MTSVMNLTLDPAKFSRPSRVESAICCIRIITMQIMSSSFYSQIKVLPEKEQKASYSFFLIKSILSQFFDITGHAEQTVIASDDHALIISNQKFFINFNNIPKSYEWFTVRRKIGWKNYKIASFHMCAYTVLIVRQCLENLPCYMSNIYIVYNKVTCANA